MAFTELLEQAGGVGLFQALQALTLLLLSVWVPFQFLVENFSAAVPGHRCWAHVLDNGSGAPANLTPEALLAVSIPLGSNREPHQCLRFRQPQWQLLDPNATATNWSEAATEPCVDGWVYNRSTFTSTIVTEAWAEANTELVLPSGGRGQHQHHRCPQFPCLLWSPIFECFGFGWHHLDLNDAHGGVDHDLQEGHHHDNAGMQLQHRPDGPGRHGLCPAGLASPPAGRVCALLCHLPDVLVAARICPMADYHGQTRSSPSGTQKGGQNKWPQGSPKDTDHRGADVQNGGGAGLHQGPPVSAGPVPSARAPLEKLQPAGGEVLFGAVDFLARTTTTFLLRFFGRRTTLAGFLAMAGLAILTNMLVPQDLQTLRVVFAVLGKGCFGISLTCLMVYKPELFPTSLRMTAEGFLHSATWLGSVMGPLIRMTRQVLPLLPAISYGVLPTASSLIVLFLPETRGLPLPDTIQDLERQRSVAAPGSQQEEVVAESTRF
ncbi:solute carrier family 22 member 11 isoform X3 [Camelus dromedarius]|uniref:solute carrier family 22 member 11 isoform X3 n=1 Tax=Camelus dromedarius TaxID=9838 RepID=UPI00057B83D3|nr:solute carrier family 22 member 11 isoform X4 [Camelus dromedarius]